MTIFGKGTRSTVVANHRISCFPIVQSTPIFMSKTEGKSIFLLLTLYFSTKSCCTVVCCCPLSFSCPSQVALVLQKVEEEASSPLLLLRPYFDPSPLSCNTIAAEIGAISSLKLLLSSSLLLFAETRIFACATFLGVTCEADLPFHLSLQLLLQSSLVYEKMSGEPKGTAN